MNRFLTILLVFVVAAAAFAGGSRDSDQEPREPQPGRTPTQLDGVEVREYQGENFSSVFDFRENSIAGPQQVDIDSYRLVVDGLVETPLSLTYDEVLALDPYQKVVTLNCVEGWSATILWEGVLIEDILTMAGADLDRRAPQRNLARTGQL